MLLKEETTDNYVLKRREVRLNPLNDYLFKQYMGTEECKVCLISFLNAVLKIKLTEVEIIENLELPKETPEGKFSRLDVRAKLPDGTQVNIEVQLLNEDNIINRSQYYNGRIYISGIGQGDDYSRLGKVISINILNFNYLPYTEYHISSHFRIDQHPEEVLSEDQEIHFLELKKFYKNERYDIHNPLHRWLKYFDRNLEKEELEELIKMDEAIKVAEERTKKAALSENEMRYYEALEDARRNMISSQRYQRNQGFKAGEERFAKLAEHLLQDNRLEDLQQAIQYPELRKKLYKEYSI